MYTVKAQTRIFSKSKKNIYILDIFHRSTVVFTNMYLKYWNKYRMQVNVEARQTAVRSKRRNDMMAKSPSPRSLSTVSKQTSKKSRIVTPNGSLARSTATAASLTAANPSTSVVAAAPLSCRNLERLRDGK